MVAVARQAKSAATLISLGADEIHIGQLGELGPIDPQLGGLPALGVAQALDRIAALSERHPASAEMFARYLQRALTVEQIGYSERIVESALQYAERLLSNKTSLAQPATDIARKLVYEYKDHVFVIDVDEASQMFGTTFIRTDTPEVRFTERYFRLFESIDLFLRVMKKKRLVVIGSGITDSMLFPLASR